MIFHGVECLALAIAVTIDATLALSPVAVIHGDVNEIHILYMTKFFLTVRVTCLYSMCFLYLQKICHGDRTLFVKPGQPLQPQEPRA